MQPVPYTAAQGLGTLKDEGAVGEVISLHEPQAPNLPPHLSQSTCSHLTLPKGLKAADLGGSSCP